MYSAIFALFEEDIEKQSYGAFQSIKKEKGRFRDSYLIGHIKQNLKL